MNRFAIILRKKTKPLVQAYRAFSRPLISLTLIVCLMFTGLDSSALATGLVRRSFNVGPSSNGTANPSGPATGASQTGSIQAATVSRQSLVNLQAATRVLMAQQAAQLAGENAAQGGANHLTGTADVPDGMSTAGAGGLVPDSGLSSTGVANPVTTWINASTPTQTTSDGETTVTTVQTGQYALLNWGTFNIGKNTTLVFDQSAGGSNASNWIALNKIIDPNDRPSQILGAIKAQGQVYVINQSGILFGGSSQINVNTLVASALDLNDPGATVNGITYAHYANFLSGNGILSSNATTATSFTSNNVNGAATPATSSVDVQAGAQITASGGDVVLMAPTVENDGAITTPAGQALLVGGDNVLLSTGDSYIRGFILNPNTTAPNPNVSGGDYYSTTPGTVINNGLISAAEGNITIVGGTVTQNGAVISATSTTENGSILLDAENGDLTLGGAGDNPLYAQYGVTAAPSLVQILPDSSDTSEITDSQAISNSSITLEGVNVDVRGIVQLRGYDTTNANNHQLLNETLYNTTGDVFGGLSLIATGNSASNTTGNVFLENGSLLDTSGTTDATASASRNSVAVELRTNELADSPLIRASPLYQQTIYVDSSVFGTNADGTTWQGTPLANALGWIGLTNRSLDERLMNGAPINIQGGVVNPNSQGSPPAVNVVQAANATIDISSGYMTYTPGFVHVSELITAGGVEVDASSSAASPLVNYIGIADAPLTSVLSSKWGVSETTAPSPTGYYDPGYFQGGNGGSLNIEGNTAVLAGTLQATTVVGEKQRTAATAPIGTSLIFNSQNVTAELAQGLPNINNGLSLYQIFNADNITVSDAATAAAAQRVTGFTADSNLAGMVSAGSVNIPTAWVNSGVSTVALGANNQIELPAGNNLTLPTGGSLSLTGQRVDIESSITIPSGTIDMTAVYTINSLTDNTNFTANNGVTVGQSGLINIESGVSLNTAGTWTNDMGAGQDGSIATNGGTISLLSNLGDIDIAQSDIFNVSAGAYESSTGAITPGNGGTLNLEAGLVPSDLGIDVAIPTQSAASNGVVNFDGSQPGTLQAGQFLGYGAAYGSNAGKGGTFNLSSTAVAVIVDPSQAGGALLSQSPFASNPQSKDDQGNSFSPLTVSTSLFSSGGFSSVGLMAAGITLPANVTLAPQVSSLIIPTLPGDSAPSLADIATPGLLASGIRPLSTISLHSTGDLLNRGGFTNINSSTASAYQSQVDLAYYGLNIAGTIETDPLGTINLAGDQIAAVSGTVEAPGGTINFTGGTFTYFGATQPAIDLQGEGLWLTDTGKLLAPGVAVTSLQSNGQPYDDVLSGGSINVTGSYVILAPGSLIDVAGTSGLATLGAAGSSSSTNQTGGSGSIIPPTTVDSAGGTVSITSILGGILEGTLSGQAGGGNASGGTLIITQEGHGQEKNGDPLPGGPWPAIESTYTILEPTIDGAYYLSDAQIGTPGTNLTSEFPQIDAHTPLSVQMVENGGFASLDFGSSGTSGTGTGFLTFSGNPTLTLPDQIQINTLIVVPDGSTDTLTANYINWNNQFPFLPSAGTGVLNFNAKTMDLVGNLTVLGAATVTFDVSGDLRLTGAGLGGPLNGGDDASANTALPESGGSLITDATLDFDAGQIYPTTATNFTIATTSTDGIEFTANGAPPTPPLAAGGTLNVYASVIQQNGTLLSPNGIINLGSSTPLIVDTGANPAGITIAATTSLTLGAGSLTSVSDDGQTVPYGFTQNGDWYYTSGGVAPTQITAPPAKQIVLNGINISDEKGAVLDASGGGDFFAGAFVPGTGGSTDIFTKPNVYAVIPGYSGVAPYDPTLSTGSPSLGQKVYLSGVPGLTAGYYTLLPGQYAELPGAYLVSVQTTPSAKSVTTTQTSIPTTRQNDGSYLVSGYFATLGTGTTSEHWSVFDVMPDTIARKYTEIDNSFANTFFPAQAAAKGTTIPRLPQDAGQLSVAATGSLNFQGSGVFTPGTGGLGGLADISASQILVVDSSTANALDALVPGTAAYDAALAAYLPGASVGGAQDVDATATSTSAVTIATGNQTFTTQKNLTNFVPGQSIIVNGGSNNLSGSLVSYDPSTGIMLVNVTKTAGSGSFANWTISATTWNPIVLSAGDLNHLGVESLLLGGSRSFTTGGVLITTTANNVVIANDATDPFVLPDIQLIAAPLQVSNTVKISDGATLTLPSAKAGTGQVIIALDAVIEASGAVPAGDPTTYILSTTAQPPVPISATIGTSIQYNPTDIQTYYQEGLANQFGYLRVSGDGLSTITGGSATYNGLPSGTINVSGGTVVLPQYALGGSTTIGSGAQISSDNSLTLFASGSGTIAQGVSIAAQAAELKSTQINLGTDDYSLSGLVLDQTALNGLAGVKTLELVSSSSINLFGNVTLGTTDATTGQPILGSLILDSAGVVATTAGTSTLTAEQVTFQNSLGGTIAATAQLAGTGLVVNASDVLDTDPSGTKTGMNNATISLGVGAVTLAGFGNGVTLNSTGEIVATGDGGSLNVESGLTLNAPEIAAGSVTLPQPFTTQKPKFNTAAYTINANDNAANPGTYYNVNLVSNSGATPVLPQALLGNSLTINAENTTVSTDVALPGGAFNVNANGGGNIIVGPQTNANGTTSNAKIDVSGQAIEFVDVLASIGGGNINLNSTSGTISIESGAVLNVGDTADVGDLNKTSAGTLSLSAGTGGITIAAGTLQGQGPTSATGGSFIINTNSLDQTSTGASISYDQLASMLDAGGFTASWNIRAHTGDIAMTGTATATETLANNVTISTDTGSIDVAGTIDASGATGGTINLYAGQNLKLESTAVLDAHGAVANANGQGGQITLEADAAGQGTGMFNIALDSSGHGAKIDVGADAANSIDSGPVLGGDLTLSTSINTTGTGLNLAVTGGTFANFLNGVTGESTWDGIALVGNQTYNYTTPNTTLVLTPNIAVASVAASGSTAETEGVAFSSYLADAANFMANQSAIWTSLGADNNGVVNGTQSGGLYTNGILVNIRPGIVVKNSGGDITVEGDATNPNGIDLSGSAYTGSTLNTGDPQTLNGHFGQYDEPIVLSLRAADNLNFGVYHGQGSTVAATITLGSLSDGFTQFYNNGTSIVPLYSSEVAGAGASGAATLFDPANAGAYNGLSKGLGASSATYYLTAGADTTAADPLAVVASAPGTMTVAGIPGDGSTFLTSTGVPITTDPLYVYDNGTNGNTATLSTTTLADFVDYASLVRTGTGNINIATSKDLVLQSPLSLIYTAGTGDNINGSASQPLAGFTQYNGNLSIQSLNFTSDSLPTSVFPTNGGNVTLTIGGNLTGDMNTISAQIGEGEDQNLPYDMTALGSQLKLQGYSITGAPNGTMGGFSSLYATDAWMNSLVKGDSYYTQLNVAGTSGTTNFEATPGNYQLAWYTWFPFLENTVGSFGGGNISVKAGGSISNVQFVAPTNARDAGPSLVGTSYAFNPNLLTNPTDVALTGATPIVGGYTGLYVQGGGNISAKAGGDITDVYTYAQNGSTLLQTGGSATGLVLETSTGDVTVEANRDITVNNQQIQPRLPDGLEQNSPFLLSGISLIQNSSFLDDLYSNISNEISRDKNYTREETVLSGLLTSVPTDAVTLQAVGNVTLGTNLALAQGGASIWNSSQGILPPQMRLISLQGDVSNNEDFVTYPSPTGTVDMLARGSANLNLGFVLSDADPSIMPTIANIAAVLAPYDTTVTASNGATETLVPTYPRIVITGALDGYDLGGANFLPGQDISGSVLDGDVFGQLDPNTLSEDFTSSIVSTTVEAERHAGLHVGQDNPVRIFALDGDVTSPGELEGGGSASIQTVDLTTAAEIYAGQDVINLPLLGENNNPDDVTSIVAGQDVIYTAQPPAPTLSQTSIGAWTEAVPYGIDIGGPGNVIVQSGRNVDLGISNGIQTFGNFLNANLPNNGAGVTIETGLGNPPVQADYANFITQYVNPATDGSNQYAEPLQLFDANGNVIGSGDQAYAYLMGLPTDAQDILLNRIFFDVVRDSGREHTGAAGGGNYELGATDTIDTLGQLNDAFTNYQRAFAAIATFLPNASSGNGGSFLGGLSTVRTRDGGDITILAPSGQIQVGLAAPPASFPGYSVVGNATWALNFGIVTQQGGDINLYADGNISVNQSRVFTLEGGDMTVVSQNGNIDAGKGAKTVLSIQPPNISYDLYGDATITPYGPASGSGLAVLRALPDVPPGNADLIAFFGDVDAGDAGIRVSGNINIAAVKVLNASNISVGGKSSGIPTVTAPNIGALTSASSASGAATAAATAEAQKHNNSALPPTDDPAFDHQRPGPRLRRA